MKHFYIIGNGFDIFTGLRTRYSDFQRWLARNYAFIYEAMSMAYDIQGEWWSDFEMQLGKLDIRKYVEKFRPPDMTWEQIEEKIKERKAFEEKYPNMPPNLDHDSECAFRLEGLLDVLQYCFEKWVEDIQESFVIKNRIALETEDSYFINFNYTDVLEWLYKIPEDRVLHIHGRASQKEHLVFGHNQSMLSRLLDGVDEEKVGEVLDRYNKNPYEYIFKHDNLPYLLRDVEHIHIYGFSFSPIDEDYVDWIYRYTSDECDWEVSWFSDEDRRRVDYFVLNHWRLKDRIRQVRLEELAVGESRS